MRVLIIEDEPIVSMMLAMELRDEGHEIVGEVVSVVAALEAVALGDFDFATVDFRLIDGTTESVVQSLETKGIPYVMLTGNVDEAHKAIREEGLPIISKPFMIRDVLSHMAA